MPEQTSFSLGGQQVGPGESRAIELDVARLATSTPMTISTKVVHGAKPGPCLWISAALHGDELNGLEIVRRVLSHVSARKLAGTLVAIPIVNVFGFIHQSRYLPDGRDLNRSFPGSSKGSLAGRMASLFMREIVSRATHGIDLHTATRHRTNIAQIRADLDDESTRACAEAFGAPVTLHSRIRDGSLREAAARKRIPVLVFEGGEAQRFDETPIRAGVRGVLQVMDHLGMIPTPGRRQRSSVVARSSSWLRAPCGGLLRLRVSLGDRVDPNQVVGTVADAFGDGGRDLRTTWQGTVVGYAQNPVVHQGDGVLHVTKE